MGARSSSSTVVRFTCVTSTKGRRLWSAFGATRHPVDGTRCSSSRGRGPREARAATACRRGAECRWDHRRLARRQPPRTGAAARRRSCGDLPGEQRQRIPLTTSRSGDVSPMGRKLRRRRIVGGEASGSFSDLAAKNTHLNSAQGWLWGAEVNGAPQLSADGRTVALIGNPTEATNVYVVNMQEGLSRAEAVRQLTLGDSGQCHQSGRGDQSGTLRPAQWPHIRHRHCRRWGTDRLHHCAPEVPPAPPNLISSPPSSLGLVELYLIGLEGETLQRLTHGAGGTGNHRLPPASQARQAMAPALLPSAVSGSHSPPPHRTWSKATPTKPATRSWSKIVKLLRSRHGEHLTAASSDRRIAELEATAERVLASRWRRAAGGDRARGRQAAGTGRRIARAGARRLVPLPPTARPRHPGGPVSAHPGATAPPPAPGPLWRRALRDGAGCLQGSWRKTIARQARSSLPRAPARARGSAVRRASLLLLLAVAGAAFESPAASASEWHSEQPVAAGIGVPTALGEIGDIEFWAPNEGMLDHRRQRR